MSDPNYDRNFDPSYGRPVIITGGIERLTAQNPSPYTFYGTNTYLVGYNNLIIIDPGPEINGHFNILMNAIGKRTISHIAITHTHLDHTPMAERLQRATGAPIVAFSPHHSARPLHEGEINPFEASADFTLTPDIILCDGDRIETSDLVLEAIHTPGHTANHLAFALIGSQYLFSGDHVMGWSTTMVAPPDGSMSDYLASLEKLLARSETTYLPGHGGPVKNAANYIRAIRAHRRMRERAILHRLEVGDRTIAEMVSAMYRTTDVQLHGVAAFSVFAHLEDLVKRDKVTANGAPLLTSLYALVD